MANLVILILYTFPLIGTQYQNIPNSREIRSLQHSLRRTLKQQGHPLQRKTFISFLRLCKKLTENFEMHIDNNLHLQPVRNENHDTLYKNHFTSKSSL